MPVSLSLSPPTPYYKWCWGQELNMEYARLTWSMLSIAVYLILKHLFQNHHASCDVLLSPLPIAIHLVVRFPTNICIWEGVWLVQDAALSSVPLVGECLELLESNNTIKAGITFRSVALFVLLTQTACLHSTHELAGQKYAINICKTRCERLILADSLELQIIILNSDQLNAAQALQVKPGKSERF